MAELVLKEHETANSIIGPWLFNVIETESVFLISTVHTFYIIQGLLGRILAWFPPIFEDDDDDDWILQGNMLDFVQKFLFSSIDIHYNLTTLIICD